MSHELIGWAILVGLIWMFTGCWVPDPPTRDPKKKLKRKAHRRLCYGNIANMEKYIYGGIWTDPETGKVSELLNTEVENTLCGRWCNAHRW